MIRSIIFGLAGIFFLGCGLIFYNYESATIIAYKITNCFMDGDIVARGVLADLSVLYGGFCFMMSSAMYFINIRQTSEEDSS